MRAMIAGLLALAVCVAPPSAHADATSQQAWRATEAYCLERKESAEATAARAVADGFPEFEPLSGIPAIAATWDDGAGGIVNMLLADDDRGRTSPALLIRQCNLNGPGFWAVEINAKLTQRYGAPQDIRGRTGYPEKVWVLRISGGQVVERLPYAEQGAVANAAKAMEGRPADERLMLITTYQNIDRGMSSVLVMVYDRLGQAT